VATTRQKFGRIFFAPAAGESLSDERVASLASMRTIWVGLALALDVSLYVILRHAPGLRPGVTRIFLFVNVGLMLLDLGLNHVGLRRHWRGYRAVLTTCILSEVVAAVVWIQMTGSISSYFLVVGFLLILLYRLLFDYASGLTAALGMMILHTTVFVLEQVHLLRPASIFVSEPLGIYEAPLFRLAAMLSLLVGYVITFLALNLFVATLRDKEAALRTARLDLARAVDETQQGGRLCGQVLAGTYQLMELIGSGGMGEVYHGRRIRDGLPVAVKVLHVHLVDQAEMRERFRREALLVDRIPAQHVARVLEGGATVDGQLFIVMEYLRGEDLGSLFRRRGQLELDELVPLVDKMAVALEAAHAAGVVHRDLKPQNVFLVDGSGEVKLLDFGIARLNEGDGLTLTSELLGTAGYMAPEQARGASAEIGPHTDVFALAAIVYRALCGVAPFPSRSTAAAVYETLHLVPAPPSRLIAGLGEDVDHVLTIGLAKRSSERYARAPLLARDLRAAASSALDERSRARARKLSAQAGDEVLTTPTVLPEGVADLPRLPPMAWSGDRETRRRRRRS
jgi:serine/threonine-protein kinase